MGENEEPAASWKCISVAHTSEQQISSDHGVVENRDPVTQIFERC